MANRTKDYQDSRIARINIAITPVAKNKIEMLASIARITTNELLNRVIDDVIKTNETLLKKYANFTENENVIFGQSIQSTCLEENAPNTSNTSIITDEQRQDTIKKIAQFVSKNMDKLIDENDEPQEDTIGYKLPARTGKSAGIAVIANKVEFLIGTNNAKALSSRITINRKQKKGLIRIEQSVLHNDTEKNN